MYIGKGCITLQGKKKALLLIYKRYIYEYIDRKMINYIANRNPYIANRKLYVVKLNTHVVNMDSYAVYTDTENGGRYGIY